jgi:hypothetical protein
MRQLKPTLQTEVRHHFFRSLVSTQAGVRPEAYSPAA